MRITTRVATRSALALAAGLLALAPAAALGRPDLTENEVVATNGRQVVHLRIQTGCGDQATDRITMTIPESVIGVVPEATAGWTVETDVSPTDPYELFGSEQTERVTAIRWSGGSVPVGQFRDFGIAAVFTEPGQVAFPVTQGCATDEVVYDRIPADGDAQTESDAVTVTVDADGPAVDVVALRDGLDELTTTVEDLRTQIDDARLPRVAEPPRPPRRAHQGAWRRRPAGRPGRASRPPADRRRARVRRTPDPARSQRYRRPRPDTRIPFGS